MVRTFIIVTDSYNCRVNLPLKKGPEKSLQKQANQKVFRNLFNKKCHTHSEKFFPNLVKTNQIWIVISLFRLMRHQTEFRLVIVITIQHLVSFNKKFTKRFLYGSKIPSGIKKN